MVYCRLIERGDVLKRGLAWLAEIIIIAQKLYLFFMLLPFWWLLVGSRVYLVSFYYPYT